uniref:HPP family protein n=1 Tax=Candidatus Kentrum sp. DK TaxID=2126562 RepID=A0A450S7J7_9GAMM|nr:MAG: HPP family protein [Candidatus Kentron sp. DK]VFJ56779.1 MAG: HPP family protein [Candidatus Kentron sp. DK]
MTEPGNHPAPPGQKTTFLKMPCARLNPICHPPQGTGQGREAPPWLEKRRHALQAFLAGLFIGVVLLVAHLVSQLSGEGPLHYAIVVSSIAASTFLIFILPELPTSWVSRLVCGHVISTIAGGVCYLFITTLGGGSGLWLVVSGFLAMWLATYGMIKIGAPHPPAAATALGFGIAASWPKLAFIAAAVLLLALAKCLFSRLPESLRKNIG